MSALEAAFLFHWHVLGGKPEPEREFRFHPSRRWRFDFAWPEARVAVECEGGVWVQGRHTRGGGFVRDCLKYNQAAALGWTVFRLVPEMLERDPEGTVAMIQEAVDGSDQD